MIDIIPYIGYNNICKEVIYMDIIKELTSLINELTLLTLALIILKLVSKMK